MRSRPCAFFMPSGEMFLTIGVGRHHRSSRRAWVKAGRVLEIAHDARRRLGFGSNLPAHAGIVLVDRWCAPSAEMIAETHNPAPRSPRGRHDPPHPVSACHTVVIKDVPRFRRDIHQLGTCLHAVGEIILRPHPQHPSPPYAGHNLGIAQISEMPGVETV